MALRQISRDIVAGVLLTLDNKILIGKKDPLKGGVYIDSWHIPGGGAKEGETMVAALIREIKEEIGLDISNESIKLLDDTKTGISEKTLKVTGEKVICNMRFIEFLVRLPALAKDLQVVPLDDLVELKWVSIFELSAEKLTPPSVELFKQMGYLE